MAELFPWLYNNVLLCHNSWFGIYSLLAFKEKEKEKAFIVPEPFRQT